MTITAKMIEDSITEDGQHRLSTLQLRYPRFIHAEFMTHRVFSRNASSSRAIPVKRQIQDIIDDPAMPIHWGKNQEGMQAREELPHWPVAKEIWLDNCRASVQFAKELMNIEAHKQIVNRLLEPFAHISVIVSATEWQNFFDLRCHPDAQPEIQALANLIRKEIEDSKPKVLKTGQWHLPYVSVAERETEIEYNLLKMSAARCARVSYLTHDGQKPTIDQDVVLFDRLAGSRPIHASPLEHQATPCLDDTTFWGNFQGFSQHRKIVESTLA